MCCVVTCPLTSTDYGAKSVLARSGSSQARWNKAVVAYFHWASRPNDIDLANIPSSRQGQTIWNIFSEYQVKTTNIRTKKVREKMLEIWIKKQQKAVAEQRTKQLAFELRLYHVKNIVRYKVLHSACAPLRMHF